MQVVPTSPDCREAFSEGSMYVEKDAPITTRDGRTIMANVFRPMCRDRVPIIMCFTCYGKDIHFAEKDPVVYSKISLNSKHDVYEAPDIIKWVENGYAVVIVDTAGLGASPGKVDVWSRRDVEDYYDAIEFMAVQPWCTGRVGLNGVSYLSATQVAVASLRPPHLTCMIPWEVTSDIFGASFQEGMENTFFLRSWFDAWIVPNQHGFGRLSEEELASNLIDFPTEASSHPLLDDYWRDRLFDLSQIETPFLTAANWTGGMISLPGHFDLFDQAQSRNKWLRVHSGGHIDPFYSEQGFAVQKQFMDYWLKDVSNGMEEIPPLQFALRHSSEEEWVSAQDWPLPETHWTKWYLNGSEMGLSQECKLDGGVVTFESSMGELMKFEKPKEDDNVHHAVHLSQAVVQAYIAGGVNMPLQQSWNAVFSTAPLDEELRLIGPITLHLEVSASHGDADLFVCVRNLDPNGKEVVYEGLDNPETPVSVGWGRLSRRAKDEARSKASLHRPVHRQDREDIPGPDEPVEIEIAVGPTSSVFDKGHRLVIEVSSRDVFRAFPFFHITPKNRRTGGNLTLHTGGGRCWVELPVVPG